MKRSAAAGDVLFTDTPYAHVLAGKERGRRCDQCFKTGSLQEKSLSRCSKCKTAHYCTRECQRLAWPLHRRECEGFLRVKPEVPSASVRLLARLVLRHADGDGEKKREFVGLLPGARCFDDLVSHVEDLVADPRRRQDFVVARETLRVFLGADFVDALFPGDPRTAGGSVEASTGVAGDQSSVLVLAGIFGRMTVNSFSILDTEQRPIGVGLFLQASKIDHRCDGNLTPTFNGINLVIRARREIEELAFSNLSLSYVDPLAPTWERRSRLASQYHFLCRCSMCGDVEKDDDDDDMDKADDEERLTPITLGNRDAAMLSFRCPSSQKTGKKCEGRIVFNSTPVLNDDSNDDDDAYLLHLSPDWRLDLSGASFSPCDVCRCLVSVAEKNALISSGVDAVRRSVVGLAEIEEVRKGEDAAENVDRLDKTLHLCEKLLRLQRPVLHPYNVYMLRTLDHAFDLCVHLGKWEGARKHGTEMLAPIRFYHDASHPTLGIHLLKLGKLLLFLEQPTPTTLALLDEAAVTLRLTHGPSSDGGDDVDPGRVTREAEDLAAQARDAIGAKEAFLSMAPSERRRIASAVTT